MESFENHFKVLDIRSPIQKKAVEILSGLHGYSKRLDLLHDQLRRELAREGIGASRISQQISELVDLGLASKKTGTEGVRLSLNKDIWGLDPKIICSSRDLIGHLPGLTGRGCQIRFNCSIM